jgi:hypothetical protein
MDYRYRNGDQTYRGVDASVAAEELDRIRRQNGGVLRTEDVWRDARRTDSPIHRVFTWNLRQAAEKCWSNEARVFVRLVVERPDNEPVEFRPKFIHVQQIVTTQVRRTLQINYYQDRNEISETELSFALARLRRFLKTVSESVQDVEELLVKGGANLEQLQLLIVAKNSVGDAERALAQIV